MMNLEKKLNEEQQCITKEIIMWKKNNTSTPFYLFLTRYARTRKTTTSKTIYYGLLHHYIKDRHRDPLKKKGTVDALSGNVAYNANGATTHSAFHLPLSSSNILPLSSNTLDTLTKYYEQLGLLLVDEALLIDSQMLHNINKRLREIMHRPTSPFENIDIIFYGDLFQAQMVRDSWIFEQPKLHSHIIPSTF